MSSMTQTNPTIHPGQIVRYETFSGVIRTVRITEVHEDVKNGRPGFDAVDIETEQDEVWGYTAQIIR